MAMTECRECGQEVSSKAKSCPHCGVKNPGKKKQKGIGWGPGCAIIVVLMIVGGLFYEDEPPRSSAPATPAARTPPAPPASPRRPRSPYPPPDRVLATDLSGRWVEVDFLATQNPLGDAQRCVRSRADAAAVACFAFASRALYRASGPESAGNFKGGLCYEARWQRNAFGEETGGVNTVKLLLSGDPCPE